jgi:hypothetical protein
MKHLFIAAFVIALVYYCNSVSAQVWNSVPIPPGITKIGDSGNHLEGSTGNFSFASTDYGAKFYRFMTGHWDSIPLPPGVTQLNSSGSHMNGGAESFAYVTVNSVLYRYNYDNWEIIPSPPGVNQEFKGTGGNFAYATSEFGVKLNRFNGSTWDSIPLPPDVTQLGSYGSFFLGAAGFYAYAITNFGYNLFRFDGDSWDSIPLPPGISQLPPNAFAGAGGKYAYAISSSGANLFQYDGNQWNTIPLPPGVTQLGSLGSTFAGANGHLIFATTDYGANLYQYGYCSSDMIMTNPSDTNVSKGNNVHFTVVSTDSGMIYQWQTNPIGAGWLNLSDINQYSGVMTNNLSVSNVAISNHQQPFRVIITSASCRDTSTIASILVTDTCILTINDTVHINIQDTIHVTIHDTVEVTLYDTISVTDTLIIDVTLTGMTPPGNRNKIKVYPNPVHDFIYINTGDYIKMNNYVIRISNSSGQIIWNTTVSQQEYGINLNSFGGTGLYILQIINDTGDIIEIKKILLE